MKEEGFYYVEKSDGSRKWFPSLPSDAYFLGGFQSAEDKGKLYKMHLDSTGGTVLSPLFHRSKPGQVIALPEHAGKMVHELGKEKAAEQVFRAVVKLQQ